MDEKKDRFYQDLEMAIADEQDRILAGNFPDYGRYQRECGVLAGLERAKELFEEVFARYEVTA